MLRVALATENNLVDGVLLMDLLAMLGVQAQPWSTAPLPFRGWQGVHKNLPDTLEAAALEGVTRALVSIDNDGRPTNRPEHDSSHVVAQQMLDRSNGCRTCRMLERIPESWRSAPHRYAVVVPVQTIETWLLLLASHAFKNPVAEKNFDRKALKRAFWGEWRHAPDAVKVAFARAQFWRPGAVDLLLTHSKSFRAFEEQIQEF